MKPLILIFTLLITACTPFSNNNSIVTDDNSYLALKDRLVNPLFAEQYAKALVGRLTELAIDKDPILDDKKMRDYTEETKRYWLKFDRNSRKLQQQGIRGMFVGDKEFAKGEILLINNQLFIGEKFETDPGPELHIFLTEVIDPRNIDFPDQSSVDLGILQSPFGAQRYTVPIVENIEALRTAVLWDIKLNRLYGFAQLNK